MGAIRLDSHGLGPLNVDTLKELLPVDDESTSTSGTDAYRRAPSSKDEKMQSKAKAKAKAKAKTKNYSATGELRSFLLQEVNDELVVPSELPLRKFNFSERRDSAHNLAVTRFHLGRLLHSPAMLVSLRLYFVDVERVLVRKLLAAMQTDNEKATNELHMELALKFRDFIHKLLKQR